MSKEGDKKRQRFHFTPGCRYFFSPSSKSLSSYSVYLSPLVLTHTLIPLSALASRYRSSMREFGLGWAQVNQSPTLMAVLQVCSAMSSHRNLYGGRQHCGQVLNNRFYNTQKEQELLSLKCFGEGQERDET